MTRKKNLLIVLPAALVLSGAVFLAVRPRSPHAVKVGESAPRFDLPTLAEGTASLGDFHGQVVVLNFWATWCPPCVEETPSLEKFAEKAKPLGVVVLGVSMDTDLKALQKFVTNYHLTFPITRHPSCVLPARYRSFQFPETYILDRNGRVAEKIISNDDWDDPRMLSFVEALARPGQGQ